MGGDPRNAAAAVRPASPGSTRVNTRLPCVMAGRCDTERVHYPTRFARSSATALSVALVVSAMASQGALADPAITGSAQGACDTTGNGGSPGYVESADLTIPASSMPLPRTVSRITTSGPIEAWYPAGPTPISGEAAGPGAGYNIQLPGAGTYWGVGGPLAAGQPAYSQFICFRGFRRSAASATVDVAPMPSTPASYAGMLPAGGGSAQYFVPVGPGRYQAKISVGQGAVRASAISHAQSFTAPPSQLITTSGTLVFAAVSTDPISIDLQGVDGPPAPWTVQVEALSVNVEGPKASPAVLGYGAGRSTISYSVDAPVRLSAAVVNASGVSVRSLARDLVVSAGPHSLFWDGLGATGQQVTDGKYTVISSFVDNTPTAVQRRTPITVDTRAPTIKPASKAKKLARLRATVWKLKDAVSGLRSGYLAVDGRTVDRLGAGETALFYRPRGGWRRGSRHSVLVVAKDRAGNNGLRRAQIRIK